MTAKQREDIQAVEMKRVSCDFAVKTYESDCGRFIVQDTDHGIWLLDTRDDTTTQYDSVAEAWRAADEIEAGEAEIEAEKRNEIALFGDHTY
jgi:hypothetical protein